MLGGSWKLGLQLHHTSRWTYVKVRKNIDVSRSSIWRKQRAQEEGRDYQMGGREIASEVEGEEKPFFQTHHLFLSWERLFPSEELGSCSTGDRVRQVSGSKIKTSMSSQGKNSPVCQSAVCLSVCLCCWVLPAKGLPESRLDHQPRDYVAVMPLCQGQKGTTTASS